MPIERQMPDGNDSPELPPIDPKHPISSRIDRLHENLKARRQNRTETPLPIDPFKVANEHWFGPDAPPDYEERQRQQIRERITNLQNNLEGNQRINVDPTDPEYQNELRQMLGRGGIEFGPKNVAKIRIMISNERGEAIPVEVPKDPEKLIQAMRDVLKKIEQSDEPDGGPAVKRLDATLQLIMSHYISELHPTTTKGKETKALGEFMLSEYKARMTAHRVFLEFGKTDKGEEIKGLLSNISHEHMDHLFVELPEVWTAFKEQEARIQEFISADEDRRKQIRLEIAAVVDDKNSTRPRGKYPLDGESAQNIAENFLHMTGRMAIHNYLADKDTNQRVPRGEWGDKERKFRFGGIKGTEGLSKLLKMHESFYTEKGIKFSLDLIDFNEIAGVDFFTLLPEKVEARCQSQLFPKYFREESDNPQGRSETDIRIKALTRSREAAEEVAMLISGLTKRDKIKEDGSLDIDDVTGEAKREWVREMGKEDTLDGKGRFNFINPSNNAVIALNIKGREYRVGGMTLRYEERDLVDPAVNQRIREILGGGDHNFSFINFDEKGHPFDGWSGDNIGDAFKFREALLGDDKFLKMPTEEKLIALGGDLAKKGEFKEKLAEAFIVKFTGEKREKMMGLPSYSMERRLALMYNLLGVGEENKVPFIPFKDLEDRNKKLKNLENNIKATENIFTLLNANIFFTLMMRAIQGLMQEIYKRTQKS